MKSFEPSQTSLFDGTQVNLFAQANQPAGIPLSVYSAWNTIKRKHALANPFVFIFHEDHAIAFKDDAIELERLMPDEFTASYDNQLSARVEVPRERHNYLVDQLHRLIGRSIMIIEKL